MNDQKKEPRVKAPSMEQYEELQRRLADAEQTLEAIRHGDVDALVMTGPKGEQVYSLAGAEHVYRMIVETMHEAALTVDSEGTILFCNQRFCDLMKTTIQGVMGHKVTAFAARPQQPPLKAVLADAHAGPVQRRLTLRAADGSTVSAQLSASPLQAEGSTRVCLVVMDLTELEASAKSVRVLREQQQALEESEERFRVAQEYSPDGFVILRPVRDAQGRITDFTFLYQNAAGARMNGTASKAVVGRRLGELFPCLRGMPVFEAYQQVAESGQPRVLEAFYQCETLPTPIWLRLAVVSMGKDIAVLSQDITERKQAEGTLRDLNATLESKVAQRTAQLQHRARQLQKLTLELSQAEERERQRLAEILHDDLQQQLAAAKFHLGLLGHQVQGDGSLREAVDEVESMIKDAIGTSRSLSRELSPALLYHGDFTEALEWLANQIQAKHGLVVHVQTYGPIEVSADPIKTFLFRAAQEILFNIVKHACVAEATLRLQRRRGQLWLGISDRGRGFDPRILEQVPGFGLLSIRERVELLGGRMKIRSAPGRGSTFLVAVPDGDTSQTGSVEETVAWEGPGTPVPHEPGDRLRVLLVDDHEVMREGLATLLNGQADIEVVGQAADGREAIHLAHQLRPDVVVMDMAMPVMNGDEATRRIRRHIPGTRVIGLSMFEEPAMAEQMHRAGAESYLLKTAPPAELLAAIRGRGPGL